jgi:hypothetical protein
MGIEFAFTQTHTHTHAHTHTHTHTHTHPHKTFAKHSCHMFLMSLAAWSSGITLLRVREVPGSIPGAALCCFELTHQFYSVCMPEMEFAITALLCAASCLVWWYDSRSGCKRSRVRFPEQPWIVQQPWFARPPYMNAAAAWQN